MVCDFSLKHYREILEQIKQFNFLVTNFSNYQKIKNASKIIVLRHDIDALPKRHLKLAEIEKSFNVKATYFVRVHGQYYYPSEPKTYTVLQELLKMGHEIGLHTEARSLSGVLNMDPINLFLSEKKYLEGLLKIKVKSASEHGDLGRKAGFWQNKFLRNSQLKIENWPAKFKTFKYLSDSLGRWREGCICQNLQKYNKIQILIHGEWWGKDAKKEMVGLNRKYAKV